MSDINEVVERVKARVAVDGRAWIPTDMIGNYVDCASDDIRTLIAAYEKAVSEREKDTARLDWIESRGCSVSYTDNEISEFNSVYFWMVEDTPTGDDSNAWATAPTFRGVIDAAMEASDAA